MTHPCCSNDAGSRKRKTNEVLDALRVLAAQTGAISVNVEDALDDALELLTASERRDVDCMTYTIQMRLEVDSHRGVA